MEISSKIYEKFEQNLWKFLVKFMEISVKFMEISNQIYGNIKSNLWKFWIKFVNILVKSFWIF